MTVFASWKYNGCEIYVINYLVYLFLRCIAGNVKIHKELLLNDKSIQERLLFADEGTCDYFDGTSVFFCNKNLKCRNLEY